MVYFIWRLERRLKEGGRSNQSTWSQGNTTLSRGCSLPVKLLQTWVSWRAVSRFPKHFQSPHLVILNSQPLCKKEEHLYLDPIHPLTWLFHGSGHRMFPGSPSALETRRNLGRGVDVGQSARQCSSWRMHTPESTGHPRRPSHLGLGPDQHVGLPSPHGLHWEAILQRPLSPKLPGHLLLAP